MTTNTTTPESFTRNGSVYVSGRWAICQNSRNVWTLFHDGSGVMRYRTLRDAKAGAGHYEAEWAAKAAAEANPADVIARTTATTIRNQAAHLRAEVRLLFNRALYADTEAEAEGLRNAAHRLRDTADNLERYAAELTA